MIWLLLACTAVIDLEDGQCFDAGDCTGLAICAGATAEEPGACETVECLETAQCALEQYCDVEAFTCVPGCQSNDDCFAGDVCDDTATCVPGTCTDSDIDCALGEQCSDASGACEPAANLCDSCAGDGRAACQDTVGGECRWWGSDAGSRCHPPCDPNDPTPRGFDCLDFSSDSSGRFRLWGDCERLATEASDGPER